MQQALQRFRDVRAAGEADLERVNGALQANPEYHEFLRSIGVTAMPGAPNFGLNDQQRKQAEAWVRANVHDISNLEIDKAGNINQNEGLGTQLSNLTPGLMAAGAAFGAGSLLGGLGGGAAAGGGGVGAGAGGGAAGVLPSSQIAIPGMYTAAAPAVGAGAGTAGAGMSILGGIGSGIKNAFTKDPLGTIGQLGSVLSGGAKGSAEQRLLEGNQMLNYGRALNEQARDTYNAGLSGAMFQREGQDRERKAQMLMSLLNGMQDLRLTPGNPKIAAAMGNVAGGARPSAITGNKDALMALLSQPQTQAPTYQPAKLPEMPTAGFGEKLMGGLGLGGSILGVLGALGKKQAA